MNKPMNGIVTQKNVDGCCRCATKMCIIDHKSIKIQ